MSTLPWIFSIQQCRSAYFRLPILGVACFIAILTASPDAQAWGRTGHKVVCQIAYERLSESTRSRVDELIALDPVFAKFSDVCSWADSPRKRATEHYLNISRDTRPGDINGCGNASKCILSAINADRAILTSASASRQEKLAALKFLAHWIGDLHQPFHVSFADDRGGNEILTKGLCRGTLHGAWDGCILERKLGKDAAVITTRIMSGRQSARFPAQSNPADWANESFAVVIQPTVRYCTVQNGECRYSDQQSKFLEETAKRTEFIDDPYLDLHIVIISDRLLLAGKRLADVLETELSGGAGSNKSQSDDTRNSQ